jgi:hypothetical protein
MKAGMKQHTPCIEELCNHRFFVPSYQRGYRWTPDEVRDLLDDIRQFAEQKEINQAESYCIQPLVVRLMESGQWEVIDGQQRLTTIYLITRYINEMWRGRQKDPMFSIHYESRDKTEEFLQQLAVNEDGTVTINDENIDFAHITKAYAAINNWVNESSNLNRDDFVSKLRRSVRVIWYEPVGADSVKIFTRINSGKIPLTNAELIRGLFLKSSNFSSSSSDLGGLKLARLRQMEISAEWDRIEATLHDDKFWYFLANPKDRTETRIDMIFRLLTGKEESDSFATFRAYSRTFPQQPDIDAVQEEWNQVKACFETLQDWYQDWSLYHLIGFLVATGTPVKTLWQECQGLRKSAFQTKLRQRIQAVIPVDLASLGYGDREQVKKVLLLHNILTTLNSREEHFRFPFNRYKNQKWDVEHIHSVAERSPESPAHQKEWLLDASNYITNDASLKDEILEFMKNEHWERSAFDAIYTKTLKHFSENSQPEDINDLRNLALLDSGTNRGYGNAVFPAKRATIIQREREGVFVPIATKNAFFKIYSEKVENFTFWSSTDREAYYHAIVTTLASFFNHRQGGLP